MLTRLSTLHIFDQLGAEISYDYHSLGHGLGSLVDFNRLRDLEVPVEILLGDADVATFRLLEVLPKSIIRLTLRDDLICFCAAYPFAQRNLVIPLQAFLEDTNLKLRLPNLLMLHLCFQIEHYGILKKAQEAYFLQLSGAALAAGVEFAQRYEYKHYTFNAFHGSCYRINSLLTVCSEAKWRSYNRGIG